MLHISGEVVFLKKLAYGGGLPYLMGPTGGFLFGFLMASLIVGELADRGWGKFLFKSVLSLNRRIISIWWSWSSLLNGTSLKVIPQARS